MERHGITDRCQHNPAPAPRPKKKKKKRREKRQETGERLGASAESTCAESVPRRHAEYGVLQEAVVSSRPSSPCVLGNAGSV